jgi:hypothetical protein
METIVEQSDDDNDDNDDNDNDDDIWSYSGYRLFIDKLYIMETDAIKYLKYAAHNYWLNVLH